MMSDPNAVWRNGPRVVAFLTSGSKTRPFYDTRRNVLATENRIARFEVSSRDVSIPLGVHGITNAFCPSFTDFIET
jgi:hypothetical protein